MIVCANGNVLDFCNNHNMLIVEIYDGEIEDYKGVCRVLVTDKDMTEAEYYYLKGKMLAAGVELVSTWHDDRRGFSEFLVQNMTNKKSGGRYMFGYQNMGGEVKLTDMGRAVVKRIFELRDIGYTYRKIQLDDGVHHLDGRNLSISTIQIILKNREKYEKEDLR